MKSGGQVQRAAPDIATSLIVPCTDRQPMSPPGKNSGDTTWLSVDITMRRLGLRQQPGLVVALREPLVVERGGEQLLDSCAIARPPDAVRQVDAPVA